MSDTTMVRVTLAGGAATYYSAQAISSAIMPGRACDLRIDVIDRTLNGASPLGMLLGAAIRLSARRAPTTAEVEIAGRCMRFEISVAQDCPSAVFKARDIDTGRELANIDRTPISDLLSLTEWAALDSLLVSETAQADDPSGSGDGLPGIPMSDLAVPMAPVPFGSRK